MMRTFLWQGALAASLIAAGAVPAAAQTGYGSMLATPQAPSRSAQPQFIAAQHSDSLIPPAEPLPGARTPVGAGVERSVMEPSASGNVAPDYSRFPAPPASTGAGYGSASYGSAGYGSAGGAAAGGADCYGAGGGAGYGAGGYATGGGYGSGSFVSSGSEWDGDVYSDVACESCGPSIFGGANALLLTRNRANSTWLSYDTANIANQRMKTEDASFGYGGGFEVFAGICCGGGWAVEGRYWGWFPGQAEANVYDPDGLGVGSDLGVVIPNMDMLNYDDNLAVPGTSSVDSYYQNAARHRIRMENEIHNVELNLFNSPLAGSQYANGVYGSGYAYGGGYHSGVAMNVLGGARYLRFDEGFLFSTDPSDGVFTGAADELHYLIETENNLMGAQVGGNLSWYLTRRFSLNSSAKIGLYANQMNHRQLIRGANGFATVGAVGPWAGQAYHVNSSDTRMSTIAELDFGASYQAFSWLKLTGGYRVMGVSGVALTENQIPTYFAGLDDVAEIDSNGDLLLHGAYAGVEFCW